MIPSNQLIVKEIPLKWLVPAVLISALTLFPILASADEDPCRETGISIGNQTGFNLWYTRNGGSCTIWNRGHILSIKAEDTLIIYRDMSCKTEYCPQNPNYDVYKSLDIDQNCRVRILPGCTASDM